MSRVVRVACWCGVVLGCLACSKGDSEHCGDEHCAVGTLPASQYCGDPGGDCLRLASLSHGCIGSHTELSCDACAGTFVRVGGDDAADLYFDGDGKLAAVRRIGEGTPTCEAWFGLNLSDCVARGKPVEVDCDGNAHDGS
jgi:hypothetical protein